MGPMYPPYRAQVTPTDPRSNWVSTTDTVTKMIQLVRQESAMPSQVLQDTLQQILKGIGRATPSDLDLARGVFWWVKNHVKFVSDEQTLIQGFGVQDLGQGKELLLSPSFMLSMDVPQGDCDDFSTLIATLLVMAGLTNVCFCTVGADPTQPQDFTHVYVKVILADGTEYPIDASHGQYPGWETGNVTQALNWFIYQAGLPQQLGVDLTQYIPAFL